MPTFWAKRLHISWLLSWFSFGLILGIALAFWTKSSALAAAQWLIVSSSLLFIALTKRTVAMVLLALIAGLLAGLVRGGSVVQATTTYQKFIGQNVSLSGVVADDVTHKNGEAGLKLSNISLDGIKLGGQVWASAATSLNLKRGDQATLTGKLESGFGTYAASLNNATLTGAQIMVNGDWPRQVRDKFAAGLNRALPQPEALLGLGYLTGQHNNLPDSLTKQLQQVGLIHLVIAGGYNVTILIRLIRRRLAKTSRYLALVGGGSILLGFTLMAGFSAPMARTAVVTGISLLAWYYGRKIHPLVLLPVSAAITAAIDPTFVWGDVGWYMTFVAYGGLIMLAPLLKRYFWPGQKTGLLKQILVDTLSVQLVTMPLIAFAFGQYSIYGLPANWLVLPLMPLTMLLAFVAGIGGMILPAPLAHIVGWPAFALLGYTNKIATTLANAPGASAVASLTAPPLLAVYLILIAGIFWLWQRYRFNFRAVNVID